MSVISDLYLLDGDDEVPHLFGDEDVRLIPPKENILPVNGMLESLYIAQLYTIILSGDFTETLDKFPWIFFDGDEEAGAAVYKWPDEFVARLAQLNAEELKQAAHAWYHIEDNPNFFGDETGLYKLLQEVKEFAIRAVNLKKYLYVLCAA
jgi:hypothetical protein